MDDCRNSILPGFKCLPVIQLESTNWKCKPIHCRPGHSAEVLRRQQAAATAATLAVSLFFGPVAAASGDVPSARETGRGGCSSGWRAREELVEGAVRAGGASESRVGEWGDAI
jgi:hypothetical protein